MVQGQGLVDLVLSSDGSMACSRGHSKEGSVGESKHTRVHIKALLSCGEKG